MTITAATNLASSEKKDEKVEKRRALGRGLESLLPGPRVVSPESRVPTAEPRPPFAKDAKDEAPAASAGFGETRVPHFVRNDKNTAGGGVGDNGVDTSVLVASEQTDAGRTGASAPNEPEIISIQAVAVSGNTVTNLAIELIDKNPYQTRYVFDEEMLIELRDSIKEHGVVQPVVVRRRRRLGATSWCWASGGCGHRRWLGRIPCRRWCGGSRHSRRRR